MAMVRGLSNVAAKVVAIVVVMASAHVAFAQPRAVPLPVVGATELVKWTPPSGFIEDAVAGDGARIAYVVADAAAKAELHVVSLATKQELVVDIAPITLHPVAVQLFGPRAFVIGRTEDGMQIAALVELAAKDPRKPAGTPLYKLGPANHITVITRDGRSRVAVHRTSAAKERTRHDTQLFALDTGRRVAAGRPLELDTAGANAKLALRVNHWSEGFTRAHGVTTGAWDRKENQRAPDAESTYDLVTGKLARQPVADLFEQKRRFDALSDADGRMSFVRTKPDGRELQLWHANRVVAIALDQPFASYDLKSLNASVHPDGSAWLALKIDPVHPDAIARKKADPEYLDVFRIASDGKAVRKARILAAGTRHRFGVIGDRFWLLERNAGFDRGGKSLTLYAPQ